MLPVGSIAVAHVGPAEAVEPDHGGHWQVARHEGHQQAPVLGQGGIRFVLKENWISFIRKI